MSRDKKSAGVIAHLVGRAIGITEPYELVLTSGERVPGPVKSLVIDTRLVGKIKRTQSTLEVKTATGRHIYVNDIADVVLTDGSPLPPPVGNSGVGKEYWK